MQQLRSAGMIGADNLSVEFASNHIMFLGQIAMPGRLVVTVDKLLRVHSGCAGEEDCVVQTFRYAYNLSVRGFDTVFRHDNVHVHPGHSDAHHRHDFEWRTGRETAGSPSWIGEETWPTLGDFIRDAHAWYVEHREALRHAHGDPDGFVEIDEEYVSRGR